MSPRFVHLRIHSEYSVVDSVIRIGDLVERVRPAAERPLIRTAGDLERLFRDREPLYREFAGHVVDGVGSVAEVAERVREELLQWSR